MLACSKLTFPLEKRILGVLRADVGGVKIDSSQEGQPGGARPCEPSFSIPTLGPLGPAPRAAAAHSNPKLGQTNPLFQEPFRC